MNLNDITTLFNRVEFELIENIFKHLNSETYKRGWYETILKERYKLTQKNIDALRRYFDGVYPRLDLSEENQLRDYYQQAYDLGYVSQNILELVSDNHLKREVVKTLDNLRKHIANTVSDEAIKIAMKVDIEVNTGIKTYDQAIRDAHKEVAEKGITAVQYERKDGTVVNYGIEGYVRRELMTSVAKANDERARATVEELEADQYVTSQHANARNTGTGHENHHDWQGKVFDKEEFDEKTGRGKVDGLGGINCRHTYFAYFGQELMPPIEEEDNFYKLEQKQRKMERRIRQAKREEAIATNDEERAIARAEVKKAQKAIREFIKTDERLTRDYLREAIA